ncbi:MAG: type II secretion system F family protein [Actinomycetes bacterium]
MNASYGALLGLVLAVGLLTFIAGIAANRRPKLVHRLHRRAGGSVAVEPGHVRTLISVLSPKIAILGRTTSAESSEGLRGRLASAGRPQDIDRYRIERLSWIVFGGAGGIAATAVLLARGGQLSVVLLTVLVALGGFLGLVLHERALRRSIRRRAERMSDQLPTVAELLAFSVAAGETPLAAIRRLQANVGGELAEEFGQVIDDVRAGTAFITALTQMSRRSASVAVTRFVDALIVASERGTPMAEVLRAQAADSRAASRRQLMEGASKKESLMIAPIVFLVLPMLVVIALYPGVYGLSFTVP